MHMNMHEKGVRRGNQAKGGFGPQQRCVHENMCIVH